MLADKCTKAFQLLITIRMLYIYSIKSLSQSTQVDFFSFIVVCLLAYRVHMLQILYESIQLHSKAFCLYCYYKTPEAKEENFIVTSNCIGWWTLIAAFCGAYVGFPRGKREEREELRERERTSERDKERKSELVGVSKKKEKRTQ